MARKQSTGIRKPMSEEARARIAESVRLAAAKKREEIGLPPIINGQPAQPKRVKPLELVQMDKQSFSPNLFEAMETGRMIDGLFSTDGGVPRATNYMIVGDPGIGKSTVAMDILSDLQTNGYKTLFISAEMTRIDLYGYVKRYPKFGKLPILFLGEYVDDNPKDVVEEAFNEGFDVVLIDSFAEVQDTVKETNRMTGSQGEKWLIDLMVRHNQAGNKTATHTTFLCIQQVTKGGVFVGSNRLKHSVTGMMEIKFDNSSGVPEPVISFSKNRRGEINKPLAFNLKVPGFVNYYEVSVKEEISEELEED